MKAKQIFRSLMRRSSKEEKVCKERFEEAVEEFMFSQCDRSHRRGVVISQTCDQMQQTIIDPNTVITSVFRIYLYGIFR